MTTAPTCAEEIPTPKGNFRRRLVTTLLYATVVPVVMASALGFLGHFHWFLDLCSHFRAQYTAWLALTAIAAMISRRRDLAVLSVVFTALNLAPLSYYHPLTALPTNSSQHDLRVVAFNVLDQNEGHEVFMVWLRKQDADVIILSEYSWQWSNALRPLADQFPHSYRFPGPANFGMAIHSKFPLTEKKRAHYTSPPIPCLASTIVVKGVPIRIFAVHPVSPITEENYLLRNEYLSKLSDDIVKANSAVIAAGDYNTTPFSAHFKSFTSKVKLKDAAQGRGYRPTYERFHPLFGIPIDHILHSPEIQCVRFEVGPDLGSDHHPVIADFTITPAGNSTPAKPAVAATR